MGGRKKLAGNQEEIHFKVSLELCKHYDPARGQLVPQARKKIALVLAPLGVSPRYVGDVWYKYKESLLNTVGKDLVAEVKHKQGGEKPRIVTIEQLHEHVRSIPFSQHTNIRTLAQKLGLTRSTVGRALRLGILGKSRSAIKPSLTPKNMQERIDYCRSFVDPQDNCFSDMLMRVDIDEKWFYMTQVNVSYIVVPGEKAPHRTVGHKSHVPKVMCLSAVARPRQNPVDGVWWDGKIGTWFFAEKKPADRTSKNCVRGTLETKPVNVNRENRVKMYINNLLLALMEKWPAWEPKVVKIQLDNAPAHPQKNK